MNEFESFRERIVKVPRAFFRVIHPPKAAIIVIPGGQEDSPLEWAEGVLGKFVLVRIAAVRNISGHEEVTIALFGEWELLNYLLEKTLCFAILLPAFAKMKVTDMEYFDHSASFLLTLR
jgi:hypothetical protein